MWLADLAIDPVTEGPVAVLTRRIVEESGTARNDFYYARWGADGWDVRRVADAGAPLFVRPTHYTGLAALNPADPGQVVIATNADPVSGAPLRSAADGERHYELYRGQRDDDGGFGWVPVTADSDGEHAARVGIEPVGSGRARLVARPLPVLQPVPIRGRRAPPPQRWQHRRSQPGAGPSRRRCTHGQPRVVGCWTAEQLIKPFRRTAARSRTQPEGEGPWP